VISTRPLKQREGHLSGLEPPGSES